MKIDRLQLSDSVMSETRERRSTTRNGKVAIVDDELRSRRSDAVSSKMVMHRQRSSLVLWQQPVTTVYYFFLELVAQMYSHCVRGFFAFAFGPNGFRITNTAYGVSNIIYDHGVEADAGVCFGVVATQYVNGLMPHYTIFNVQVSTFAKMANIHMAFMYMIYAYAYSFHLWKKRVIVGGVLLTFLVILAAYHIDGSHQSFVQSFQKQFVWCAYWVGLGVLSSVGLGTGLHTFLLYLGPHIAAVTLAAFECMSVDFPEPPYPDQIICPEEEGATMSLLTIISKVRLEAFMWGAGTAIGELPPYFMARAARLSGQMEEEEEELEELLQQQTTLNLFDRAKVAVHDLVQRVGFIGILLCASIPNPLFDLAGITCGHFLVPFWTFFGATLIGKAIIKMHIQKLFVIFVFSEHHVQQVVGLLRYIPMFGASLQAPFMDYLKKQKQKLHHKPGVDTPADSSWLSWIFEKLIIIMVVYFVMSIINSMAQSYHKRLSERTSKASQE